jgi:arylsulfatase A-like enzyme
VPVRYGRRDFLRGTVLGTVLGGLLGCTPPLAARLQGAGARVRAPNVLVIVSDDQPKHTMEYMTQTTALLGDEGVEFSRAYAAAPLCSPARASLHTGLYVHNHGVFTNEGASKTFKREGLAPVSLAPRLQEAGVACGFFGKWMNGYEDHPAWVPPGWDDWAAVMPNREYVLANRNGRVVQPKWGANAGRVRAKEETLWLMQECEQFIQKNDEDGIPWFAFAAIKSPHKPYRPSDAHKTDFTGLPLRQPPNFDHDEPAQYRRGPLTSAEKAKMGSDYIGKLRELMDLDDSVAALCAAVNFDETYVVFTTDNGEFLGEHRLDNKGPAYEEVSQIPLYVRGPGVRQGAVEDALVSSVDVTATALELAGLDPAGTDGRSLLGHLVGPQPQIEGEDAEPPTIERRAALFFEQGPQSYTPGWEALRTEAALYVEHRTGEVEFYDMDADPHQLENIAPGADGADLYDLSERLGALRGVSGEELRAEETR